VASRVLVEMEVKGGNLKHVDSNVLQKSSKSPNESRSRSRTKSRDSSGLLSKLSWTSFRSRDISTNAELERDFETNQYVTAQRKSSKSPSPTKVYRKLTRGNSAGNSGKIETKVSKGLFERRSHNNSDTISNEDSNTSGEIHVPSKRLSSESSPVPLPVPNRDSGKVKSRQASRNKSQKPPSIPSTSNRPNSGGTQLPISKPTTGYERNLMTEEKLTEMPEMQVAGVIVRPPRQAQNQTGSSANQNISPNIQNNIGVSNQAHANRTTGAEVPVVARRATSANIDQVRMSPNTMAMASVKKTAFQIEPSLKNGKNLEKNVNPKDTDSPLGWQSTKWDYELTRDLTDSSQTKTRPTLRSVLAHSEDVNTKRQDPPVGIYKPSRRAMSEVTGETGGLARELMNDAGAQNAAGRLGFGLLGNHRHQSLNSESNGRSNSDVYAASGSRNGRRAVSANIGSVPIPTVNHFGTQQPQDEKAHVNGQIGSPKPHYPVFDGLRQKSELRKNTRKNRGKKLNTEEQIKAWERAMEAQGQEISLAPTSRLPVNYAEAQKFDTSKVVTETDAGSNRRSSLTVSQESSGDEKHLLAQQSQETGGLSDEIGADTEPASPENTIPKVDSKKALSFGKQVRVIAIPSKYRSTLIQFNKPIEQYEPIMYEAERYQERRQSAQQSADYWNAVQYDARSVTELTDVDHETVTDGGASEMGRSFMERRKVSDAHRLIGGENEPSLMELLAELQAEDDREEEQNRKRKSEDTEMKHERTDSVDIADIFATSNELKTSLELFEEGDLLLMEHFSELLLDE